MWKSTGNFRDLDDSKMNATPNSEIYLRYAKYINKKPHVYLRNGDYCKQQKILLPNIPKISIYCVYKLDPIDLSRNLQLKMLYLAL